jgi:hypothetical protein
MHNWNGKEHTDLVNLQRRVSMWERVRTVMKLGNRAISLRSSGVVREEGERKMRVSVGSSKFWVGERVKQVLGGASAGGADGGGNAQE